MRKIIATFALATAAVLAGSGTALAHEGPSWLDDSDVTVVDHTVVVCGDFSLCQGDDD
ncbi:hypothetical protein ACIGO8_22745 [Streptomyces sp. NPDC053493]|uniref:hypothetical protein n=1 Tax=Streptomyces sp. NPDC053493 TaxID=3365705 RepID=UPI0037CFBBD9